MHKSKMTSFLIAPVPHTEAMAFIKDKPAVSREVFDHLLPELKARAFTITGIEGANILQTVRDRIAELPAGADWNDVKRDIVNDISPFLVDSGADPEERDRQAAAADRRAELLLRTHGFQAYQAAQYQVMERQKDVMPYWQYLTMEDEAVREAHAALDGIVLPADDPFWSSHYPPWDWGCRCQVVPISRDDYQDIQRADEDRAPDEKQIIEGARYKALKEGNLVLGPNRVVDVRSPVEKADQSIEDRKSKIQNAFKWHPGDLHIPLESLLQKYDAATQKDFLAWAKTTRMDDKSIRTAGEAGMRDVMSWLIEGETQTAGQELLAYQARRGKEFARLISTDDGKRLAPVPGTKKTEINMTDSLNDMKEKGGHWILVHSHPTDTSFSDADLAMFLRHFEIRESRVVAEGKTYIMRKTNYTDQFAGNDKAADAAKNNWQTLRKQYNNADKVISELAKEYGYEYTAQ